MNRRDRENLVGYMKILESIIDDIHTRIARMERVVYLELRKESP